MSAPLIVPLFTFRRDRRPPAFAPHPAIAVQDLFRCICPFRKRDGRGSIVACGQYYEPYIQLKQQPAEQMQKRLIVGQAFVQRLQCLRRLIAAPLTDDDVDHYLHLYPQLRRAIQSIEEYFRQQNSKQQRQQPQQQPSLQAQLQQQLKDIQTLVQLHLNFWGHSTGVTIGESPLIATIPKSPSPDPSCQPPSTSARARSINVELGLVCVCANELQEKDVAWIRGWLVPMSRKEIEQLMELKMDHSIVYFVGDELDDVWKVDIIQRLLHDQVLTNTAVQHIRTNTRLRSIVDQAKQAAQSTQQWIGAVVVGPIAYANNVCPRHRNLSHMRLSNAVAEQLLERVNQVMREEASQLSSSASALAKLAAWLRVQLLPNRASVRGIGTELVLNYNRGGSTRDVSLWRTHMCLQPGCNSPATPSTKPFSLCNSTNNNRQSDPDYSPHRSRTSIHRHRSTTRSSPKPKRQRVHSPVSIEIEQEAEEKVIESPNYRQPQQGELPLEDLKAKTQSNTAATQTATSSTTSISSSAAPPPQPPACDDREPQLVALPKIEEVDKLDESERVCLTDPESLMREAEKMRIAQEKETQQQDQGMEVAAAEASSSSLFPACVRHPFFLLHSSFDDFSHCTNCYFQLRPGESKRFWSLPPPLPRRPLSLPQLPASKLLDPPASKLLDPPTSKLLDLPADSWERRWNSPQRKEEAAAEQRIRSRRHEEAEADLFSLCREVVARHLVVTQRVVMYGWLQDKDEEKMASPYHCLSAYAETCENLYAGAIPPLERSDLFPGAVRAGETAVDQEGILRDCFFS